MTLSVMSFAFAHNGDPVIPATKASSTATTAFSFNKIFLSDYEGLAMYVDFEAVADPIVSINLLKEDKLVMEDNVRDLPGNTIYELNLEILGSGKYTLVLMMESGIGIQKSILIDNELTSNQ